MRAEIQKETDRETGKNKGISEMPINLKIFSADVSVTHAPHCDGVHTGDTASSHPDALRVSCALNLGARPNAC